MLFVILLLVFMIFSANGLQCYQCGQFNDGVGSITPCLNYSESNAHLHLKECSRKSDKFCVVSTFHPLAILQSHSFFFFFFFSFQLYFLCFYSWLHVSSKISFMLYVFFFSGLPEWVKSLWLWPIHLFSQMECFIRLSSLIWTPQ